MADGMTMMESRLTRVTTGEGIGAIESGRCSNPRVRRRKTSRSRIAGHVDGWEALPSPFGGFSFLGCDECKSGDRSRV